MLRTFDCISTVEAFIGKAVLKPIAKSDGNPLRALCTCGLELPIRNGDTVHLDGITRRQDPCRAAISASDIAKRHAGLNFETLSDETGESFRGLGGRLSPRFPKAVMDVIA